MKKYDDPRDFLRQLVEGDITDASEAELQLLASDIVDILASEDGIKIPPGNDEIIEGLKKSVFESIRGILAEAPPAEAPQPKEKYRTASAARKEGAVSRYPDAIAIPTLENFVYSMSLHQDGVAYLQPFNDTSMLAFKNGKLYFEDNSAAPNLRELSEVELQNQQTKDGIDDIDLPLLRMFYSIVLKQFEQTGYKELKPDVTVYVPRLAAVLGYKSMNEEKIRAFIDKIFLFHDIAGVVHITRNGKPDKSYYQVLVFKNYDAESNTITFSSPYMNYLIKQIYKVSIRKDKKGNPQLKADGTPLRLPTHSYLIKPDIYTERNKVAVENVFIIVQLIERAGDNIPQIKASTIIERNPQLQDRLENHSNKRLLLKRVFSKTWELLQTKTRLKEVYKNIVLPEPTDPKNIPTEKNVEDLVFSFPHKGKHKQPE